MQIIPDVIPVSQLRTHHKAVFEQVQHGPVILAQRSKPAAVLVSVADWNERERRIEMLEAQLKYLEMKRQFAENPPRMATLEQIEEEAQRRQ